MAYKIQMHQTDEMVEINNFGLMDPEQFTAEANEIALILKQTGWYRVMVHTELQRNTIPAGFLQQFPWLLSKAGFPENTRLALIKGDNAMINLDVDLFQEISLDYALNVQSFNGRRLALNWLLLE